MRPTFSTNAYSAGFTSRPARPQRSGYRANGSLVRLLTGKWPSAAKYKPERLTDRAAPESRDGRSSLTLFGAARLVASNQLHWAIIHSVLRGSRPVVHRRRSRRLPKATRCGASCTFSPSPVITIELERARDRGLPRSFLMLVYSALQRRRRALTVRYSPREVRILRSTLRSYRNNGSELLS